MQQQVIPDFESRLRRRCENLVSFHSSSRSSSSGACACIKLIHNLKCNLRFKAICVLTLLRFGWFL